MFRLVLASLSLFLCVFFLWCVFLVVFYFFFPSLAANIHDWDFPTNKVLASLGANMLLAKPSMDGWMCGFF